MSCKPCGSKSVVTDASGPLIQQYANSKFSAPLTMLLRALDQVEIKMRSEGANVSWKPSQFPEKIVPYSQKPQGTEVVSRNTPIYFEENSPYIYDLYTPSPEGGIVEGHSLCEEPPANQVPGDTYQTFTWRMQGTAWETPVFCLKDLLFYENGIEVLRRFLMNVEQTPARFYDSFIRNLVWDTGEKYILGATEFGMLWNSPDRVSERYAPNLEDYKTISSNANADAAAPKTVALTYLRYILDQFMGEDITPLNVEGQKELMMVGVEPDIHSFVYNDSDITPTSLAQGGMGFNPISFSIIDSLPYGVKFDKMWYRGDFDSNTGEFTRIPAKVYVEQNGGLDLRTNPAWLTAPYGVLTFMTARPFNYRRFTNLPEFPSNVPEESLRYLSPRFQFAPLMEKCSYTRGLVSWRAEDEFGFQPTGEKIIHVIYRRDELSSYLRQAKVGTLAEEITSVNVAIPTTCAEPELLGCAPAPGGILNSVDYTDTAYVLQASPGLVEKFSWTLPDDLPITTKLQTAKGVFDIEIVAANADATLLTVYVDPTQHIGGQFCAEDQLIAIISASPTPGCQSLLDGGLRPDPFVNTDLIGQLGSPLDATSSDVVTVFFDNGCGTASLEEFTVQAIDNDTGRITLRATAADFPDGISCGDAVKVCANNTSGCEGCIPSAASCSADSVTAIPLD